MNFTVKGRNVRPDKLLTVLSGILSAQGVECMLDLPSFTLTANLTAGTWRSDEAASGLEAKRQKGEAPPKEGRSFPWGLHIRSFF